ncbi:MAG: ROK family protein [Candidatus Omnitrophica bacterium]|nr:ROK family protein [Candidatus Omnitrophota bacterium]
MNVIVGVDIGGTKISVILGTVTGKIIEKCVIKTQRKGGAAACIAEIIAIIKALLLKRSVKKSDLLGIGVNIPGPFGEEEGVILNAPNLKGWQGINIKKILTRHFRCRVICNNDANTAALAEKMFGCGKKVRSLVYVTISTGIGSGIIIDNKLLMGANNNAGELGHTVVDLNGPRCNCGKKGCLEAIASGTAIETIARNVMNRSKRIDEYKNEFAYKKYCTTHTHFILSPKGSILQNIQGKITAFAIEKAAKKGDSLAKYIYWRAGYYFGVGLANVIQLINPEMIAFGGGVVNAGSLYFNAMNSALKDHAWPQPLKCCKIVKASLGSRVADVGAISLVIEDLRYKHKR